MFKKFWNWLTFPAALPAQVQQTVVQPPIDPIEKLECKCGSGLHCSNCATVADSAGVAQLPAQPGIVAFYSNLENAIDEDKVKTVIQTKLQKAPLKKAPTKKKASSKKK